MRRAVLALLALAGLALAIWAVRANRLWFVVPDREAYPVRGLDVSHHQGEIDWPRVGEQDLAFVWVKASEGGDWRDPRFEHNVAGARQADLAVGAYHFFTFCKPGREQADNFLDAIDGLELDLPAALDVELGGNCSHRPTDRELQRETGVWLDRLVQRALVEVHAATLDAPRLKGPEQLAAPAAQVQHRLARRQLDPLQELQHALRRDRVVPGHAAAYLSPRRPP